MRAASCSTTPIGLAISGKDYSRWNDVYRTLQRPATARATSAVAIRTSKPETSVMYVAAPITVRDGDTSAAS